MTPSLEPKPPIIHITDQSTFEKRDLNHNYHCVISIQDKDAFPKVLREDYKGRRLNLYFHDLVEGPDSVTMGDICMLEMFSQQRWLPQARKDPFRARMGIHCYAGRSRSPAAAMVPLTLYYESYRRAAYELYGIVPYCSPNPRMIYLIGEALGTKYGDNIQEEMLHAEMDRRRELWDRYGLK